MKWLKVTLLFLLFSLVCNAKPNITSSSAQRAPKPLSSKELASTDQILLISTLDGTLHAVSKKTGTVKWKLDEDPVLNVPMESSTTIKGPTFLPDPHDGSLYAYDPSSGGLTKLPFTIPELVQASPCKSSDGILYTGRKQDVWYAINPNSGIKRRVITTDSASDKCPGGAVEDMFIGRTEYKITMYDTKLNVMRWNVTYTDYSSHANEKVAHSNVLYLASSADGFVISIDRQTGQILWAQNYGYPVVAMYAWVPDGLQKVEMTSVAKETMTYLLKQADGKVSYWDKIFQGNLRFPPKEATLVPSLYVGQYQHGLYALPAMKHDGVQFNAFRNVHMLPGPDGPLDTEENLHTQLEVPNPVTPIWKLLGYHKMPPFSKLNLPKTHETLRENTPLLEHDKSAVPGQLPSSQLPTLSREISYETSRDPSPLPTDDNNNEPPSNGSNGEHDNTQIHWNEITVVAVLTSIITGLLFIAMLKKSNVPTTPTEPTQYDALLKVGQISFNPVDILGRGSAGTIVYRGNFDGRSVAVKRVVRDCFSLADREVALLRESDEHPHVIRYHCMERDAQFQYIALELCSNTLQEFVENRQYRSSTGLDFQTVLNQAIKGLDHLHRLKIVHRDVKPSNILISEPSKLGAQRLVISDFGLCKKLNPGRVSVSLKSGTAGTDGWIAPEMIIDKRERITQAVDIFSMGCVFYYVICGKHPFGDPLTRQARIVTSDYSMDELQDYEYAEEAMDVIKGMLQTDPKLRPKTGTILKHPLFWDATKTLQFFEDVSDRVEKETSDSFTMQQLERDSLSDINKGVRRDWIAHLCRFLQDDLHKFRTYKTDSVKDLLRAMRNKKHHYRELPEEVKQSLGSVPTDYLKYFSSRFPLLLTHTYRAMACCRQEPVFMPYYGENSPDHLYEMTEATIFTNLKLNKSNNVQSNENTPTKTPRPIKTISQADKDLDWRSSSARNQSSPPSNAFKSLYKNTPTRSPNNYSVIKRSPEELESAGDRREIMGGQSPLLIDNGGGDAKSIVGARLRRFQNRSPRISECSSVGSEFDSKVRSSTPLKDKGSNIGVTTSSNSNSDINSSDLPNNNVAEEDRRNSVELHDADDVPELQENESVDPFSTSVADDAVDDKNDESINKKSKKPRRRRFKKNKAKSTPLSEMSENCVVADDSE